MQRQHISERSTTQDSIDHAAKLNPEIAENDNTYVHICGEIDRFKRVA